MNTANFSRILHDTPSETSFHGNLKLTQNQQDLLKSTAAHLTATIKEGLKDCKGKLEAIGFNSENLIPRFAVQGSYAYKTIIRPPKASESIQVDIDLGVYLPFTALDNGQSPLKEANMFFFLIEGILSSKEKDAPWRLVRPAPGKKPKPTCARVDVPGTQIHIDLPLYGYPEEMASTINLQLEKVQDQRGEMDFADQIHSLGLESYAMAPIKPTEIHLAHREEGWKASSAIALRNWVEDNLKGKQYARHVCRFLKGWRQHTWPDGGGPSSILLLAATIRDWPQQPPNKLCDLLGALINTMPTMLNEPIEVPCPEPDNRQMVEDLRERLDAEAINDINRNTKLLYTNYFQALNATCPKECNRILQGIFGLELPYDPSRIVVPKGIDGPSDHTPKKMAFAGTPARSLSGTRGFSG